MQAPVGWLEDSAIPEGAENIIAFSDPFLRHRARVRSLQVLVADDHAANRMVLQRLLQKAGHRVTCVTDGEGVLAALEPNPAHYEIARWQDRFPELTLVTQNVDGLHQLGGAALLQTLK